MIVLILLGLSRPVTPNNPLNRYTSEILNSLPNLPPARKFRPESFIEKMSFGIKGGVNFSVMFPNQTYTSFSGPDPNQFQQSYNLFLQNMGMHLGFIVMYELNRDIKLSIQPLLGNYTYKYHTEFGWEGSPSLIFMVDNQQNLRMYEFPIIAGYYFRGREWRPYLQGGGYYAFASSSTTSYDITETTSDGSSTEYKSSLSSGTISQNHHAGLMGGGGIQYQSEKIYFGVEINYRFLFTKLTTTDGPFSPRQLVTGNYSVENDLWFSNLALTINVIIPIRSRKKSALPFCD